MDIPTPIIILIAILALALTIFITRWLFRIDKRTALLEKNNKYLSILSQLEIRRAKDAGMDKGIIDDIITRAKNDSFL